MSLAAALRDARQTRRVERAQAQVARRYQEAAGEAGRRVWSRSVLPVALSLLGAALVPLFTWLAVHEDQRWSIVAMVLVLLFGGQAFQSVALGFSAGEVLRHPSKAGVLLLRLCRRLPELLLTGAGWATAYVILLRDAFSLDPAGYVPLLLAILLSQVAWTCGKLLCRLVAGGTRSFDSLVLPTLAAWVLLRSIHAPSIVVGIVGGVLAAGLAALWAFALVRAWVRAPRRHLRVLGGELAILPRFLVAVGLLLPLGLLPDPTMLRPIGWWALPFVLLASLHALNRLSQAVRHAEERTSLSRDPMAFPDEARRDSRRAPIPMVLPPTHAGRRSLTRAALYLHRRQHWFRPGEIKTPIQFLRCLPVILPLALYHGWGVLLGTCAMLISTESELQTTVALLAGATAPALVTKALSFDLHRLGVDYVEQARHNLRSLVLFAALPTVLAAGIAGALAGWNDQRALVLAVIAAVFALRAGWRGFLGGDADILPLRIVLATIALLAASLWLPLATWWSTGAALAIGLAGVFLRARRWDERGLREAVQKDEWHRRACRAAAAEQERQEEQG